MGLGLYFNSLSTNKEEAWVYFIHGQSLALGNSPSSNLVSPYDVAIPNAFIYYKPVASSSTTTTYAADNGNWQQLEFGINHSLTDFLSGYGPELRFAWEMQNYLNRKIYIVKFAIGDTALNKESTSGVIGNGGLLDWDPTSPDELYKRAVQDYWIPAKNKLIAMGKKPIAKGLLWVQGERDSFIQTFADNYASNLRTLISSLRTAYGNQNMHCAIARIGNEVAAARTYGSIVRAAHESVSADANNSMIDEDAYTLQGDNVHLAESGQLGYDFFLKVKDL